MTEEDVKTALKDVYDPELGYNIVDLGLIYGVILAPGGRVDVTMTMTTPGCPAASYIEEGTRERVEAMDGVTGVDVHVVWNPPWTPEFMSDDAKRHFGFE